MLRKIKVAIAAIAIVSLSAHAATTMTYTVKKGETIYGISKSHGISIDVLLQYNPSARDGLRAGDVLVLPAESGDAGDDAGPTEKELAAAKKKTYHTVARGETLYSIAKSYGMTLEELMKLNPGVDTADYKPGIVLRLTTRTALPASQSTTKTQGLGMPGAAADGSSVKAQTSEPVKEGKKKKAKKSKNKKDRGAVAVEESPVVGENIGTEGGGDEQAMSQPENRKLSIALILPFMLNEHQVSKQAQLYTEFYKGFMLAADTLSHRGAPVKIYAFDSAGNTDTVKAVMDRPEVKSATVIIAPDDQEQLGVIATAAKNNGTYIYNTFSIKDESFADNPWMIQANVPHDAMYALAIDNFITRFDGFTPVFISHETGKNEKSEFTQALKTALSEKNVEFKEIQYPNYLSASDLKPLANDVRYVFVPASGSRTDFHKFASALKTFKADGVDPERVRVFGYPEWVTFRGDAFDSLCDLNSVIYSRFYNDQSAYPSRNLNASFRRWFGREMMDAVPSQGVLGFDTGYFLIKSLRDNDGDLSRRISPYEGIQSAFDFMTAEGDEGGRVNDALYFVYFSPGGFVEKVKL